MKNALPGRSLALCPRCGERLSVDGSYASAICPYCGETFRTADGLRAFEKGAARGAGPYRDPPRRKRHTFRWLLLCAAFFLLGRLFPPGVSRSLRNERRTEPDRNLSAPVSAPTPRPTPTPTPRPTATPRPGASPRPTSTPRPDPSPRADGVSPEFKKYMDSYEAFFDEYLDFMESADEEEEGFGYLLRYAAMMERYVEVMDSLDAIGDEELSTADELYYLEVLSRINKKLLEASAED